MNISSLVEINENLVFIMIVSAWIIYRVIRNLVIGKVDLAREALLSLAFVYACFVIKVTFFPMVIVLYAFDPYDSNLVPLVRTIQMIQNGSLLGVGKNLFGNLALLMPFGFLLPIFFRSVRLLWKMLGIGFLVSLGIEISQLILKVRIFDVDDLIFNSLGVLVGFFIFLLVNKMPIFTPLFAKISSQIRIGQKKAFAAYAFVTLLAFLSIYTYQIVRQTQTEADIITALPSVQQKFLGSPTFGEFMYIFSQSYQGQKSFAIYRRVFFNRYTILEWGDLQLDDNIYRVSGMSTGHGMNYFIIARSQAKAAALDSEGQRFPVVEVGDYYFSYARLPLNQPDRFSSFHFLDPHGQDLALSMKN